jgi:hypothetical protein
MTALDLLDLAKLKIKGDPKDLSDSSRNSYCAFL